MIRFGALGGRIFAIVFATVLASSAIFGAVTLMTLAETERQYGLQQLETMARQLKMSMEADYMQLLQLSQQMLPSARWGRSWANTCAPGTCTSRARPSAG